MLRFVLAGLCAFTVGALSWQNALGADGPEAGSAPPSLGNVVWASQGTTFEALEGKTVVVLTYVTWCPKCNVWSGDMMKQLKKSAADKPIVILALSTDTPPYKAMDYMTQRDFTGPNILHGYDPAIARQFKFDNEFFNFVVVGPDGKVAHSGNAGAYFKQASGNEYTPAHCVNQLSELGKFKFLTDEMSANLKSLIFPMELGVYPPASEINKLKRSLPEKDRSAFEKTLENFLDDRLAEVKRQASGEVADKLAAIDAATFLSTNFKTTDQGKEAKKLAADLSKDKELKKELAAKRLYEQCLAKAGGDTARQAELLRGVAKKFPGTHYAQLASGAAKDSEKPRVSPEDQ